MSCSILPLLFLHIAVLGQTEGADAAPPVQAESATAASSAEASAAAPAPAVPHASGDVATEPLHPEAAPTAPAEASGGNRDSAEFPQPSAAPAPKPDGPESAPAEPAPSTPVETVAAEPGPTRFKPGTGMILQTADEQFSMGIRLRVQFLDVVDFYHTENADGDLQAATDNTFGIRRARLQFKGHVWGKDNQFKVELALSPRDMDLRNGGGPMRTPLLDFYTEHTQLRDLSVRIGQYKLMYSRQRVISSADMEFVDRTEAQAQFNLDRDVGLHLFSEDFAGLGLFRYYAGVSVAEGRDAWEGEGVRKGDDFSYQPLLRVEVLPLGGFKDYVEGDLERSERPGLSIGAAYAFTKNGVRERGYQGAEWADGGTVDYHNVTADASFKYKGLSVFGEFYFRDGERHMGDVTEDAEGDDLAPSDLLSLDGIGYSVQTGYVLPTAPVNFGARYSSISRAGFSQSQSGLAQNSEAGATVGFFPGGHPFKLQADYFHLWGESFPGSGADRIRVQMQVGF